MQIMSHAIKVIPITKNEDWETVVDFTDKGKKEGEKIKDVLRILRRINK